jgi:hypothetical protein
MGSVTGVTRPDCDAYLLLSDGTSAMYHPMPEEGRGMFWLLILALGVGLGWAGWRLGTRTWH